MGIFDLAIVYLALGASFAVSAYLRRRNIIRALGAFLFWPLSAWLLVQRPLRAARRSHHVSDARTNRIREKLQRAISGSNVGVIELRDVFDRYVGLSLEIDNSGSAAETKAGELLRVSGREMTRAAMSALTRRNAVRLERHHIDARARFLESIERSGEFTAMMLALELATVLKDVEAQHYLERAAAHGEIGGEIWDRQNQTSSKERIAA